MQIWGPALGLFDLIVTSPVCKLVAKRNPVFLYENLKDKHEGKEGSYSYQVCDQAVLSFVDVFVVGTIKPLMVR